MALKHVISSLLWRGGGGGPGGGGGDNTCEPQFGIKLSKVCEINVTRQQVS